MLVDFLIINTFPQCLQYYNYGSKSYHYWHLKGKACLIMVVVGHGGCAPKVQFQRRV